MWLIVYLKGANFNGISTVDETEFVKYNISGKIIEFNKS